MRYSRMLEESSFANRRADYFWLLFLSSLMLLVRTHDPSSSLPKPKPLIPSRPRPRLAQSIRAYPRSSTSPSSPPRSPTCRSTFGPAGTRRRPSRSSACSPSRPRTSPLPSSHSPGCSPGHGAPRRATSSGARSATWDGSYATCGLARWSVGRRYSATLRTYCEFFFKKIPPV